MIVVEWQIVRLKNGEKYKLPANSAAVLALKRRLGLLPQQLESKQTTKRQKLS